MQLLLWVLASGSWKFLRKLRPFYSSPPAGWVHPGLNPWILRPPPSQRSEPHTKSICFQLCRKKIKLPQAPWRGCHPLQWVVYIPHTRGVLKRVPTISSSKFTGTLTWEKWMLRGVSVYSQRKRTWCLLRLNLKQVNIHLQERKGGVDEGKGRFLETSILSPQEPNLIWGWESSCFREETPGFCYT